MKALAAEYRKKMREEEQRKADEELLKTLPIREWTELRQLMRVKMVALNTHLQDAVLSWDTDESNRVLITRQTDGRTLKGEFDEAASSLHFECAPAAVDLSYVIEVRNRAAVYVQTDAQATRKPSLSREEITFNLLRDFLIN